MSGIAPWNFQIPCEDHQVGVPVPIANIREVVRGPFYRQTLWRISDEQYQKLATRIGVSRERQKPA
jgi:hypothetical protein